MRPLPFQGLNETEHPATIDSFARIIRASRRQSTLERLVALQASAPTEVRWPTTHLDREDQS